MQNRRNINIDNSNDVQDIKVEIQDKNNIPHSENTLSFAFRKNKQRVPNVLQSTLRKRASERLENQQRQSKQSKVGSMIINFVRSVSNNKVCQICEVEIPKPNNKDLEVFICEEHKQHFCESCLHHYVIYKVKNFEEVHCPHEGCPQMLDTNSKFYKQLPLDVQKAYKKVTQFSLVSKNPDMKMCPKQNCEGILQTAAENTMVCDSCKKAYCEKCLLAVHSGECETEQLKFFEQNLHYRQCKSCKIIIEKDQGCNHMICRCGNQFCYVCGEIWTPPHYGNHDQNGHLIVQAVQVPPADNNEQNETCCSRCISFFLKLLLKLFLFIGLAILMLIIIVLKDVVITIGVVGLCLFTGMFCYSYEFIKHHNGCLGIVAVLFFPITMCIGIGIAFRQLFCKLTSNCWSLTIEIGSYLSQQIWQI